jgi:hypothetical protein
MVAERTALADRRSGRVGGAGSWLSADTDRRGVEGDGHRAVEVGPVDAGTDRGQPIEGGPRRMPVGVLGTGRCDRDRGTRRRDEWLGRRRAAPVMGDLEDVDPRQPTGEQQRIHVVLDVAGEQEVTIVDRAQQHDRDPVDEGAIARGLDGDIAPVRPQDADRDVVHAEPVAGGQPEPSGGAGPRQPLLPGGIPGSRATHARLEDGPDAIAVEQQHEPRDVVLVRVGQDDRVDPPVPGWDPTVELDEQAVGIRPPVDQQATAPGALDEDRVALADIEHGDPGDPGRQADHHRAGQPDRDRQQPGRDTASGQGPAVATTRRRAGDPADTWP